MRGNEKELHHVIIICVTNGLISKNGNTVSVRTTYTYICTQGKGENIILIYI